MPNFTGPGGQILLADPNFPPDSSQIGSTQVFVQEDDPGELDYSYVWFNTSTETTTYYAPAANPTAPGQVTSLNATAGSGQVVLTWTAPSSGGSAITDYVVQFRTPAGSGSWST